MTQGLQAATVGEIVAMDFRAAAVFERFGVDFCCGGRRSIADACRAANADPDAVQRALEALPPPADDTDADVTRWRLDRLIDHIVTTHHAYVRAALPEISRHLAKVVEAHGTRHPELARVAALFDAMGRDLLQHLLKEEHVVYPYIRALAAGDADAAASSPFGTVENPVRAMEREHREAGDEMRLIRELTGGYTPPDDACATYRVTLEELAAFERDLHRHVHLENNVLFPKAVEIERAFWAA